MPDEIKRIIIQYCSPVLLGCKPAALFMLHSERAFALLSGLLRPRFKLMILRKNERGLLVLVFEKDQLEETLLNREILAVLAGRGYPAGASLFVLLDYLIKRFARKDFPHEIGLFLGYPVEDVLGFVRHKGLNYKLCGYWKVYGDVDSAKKCFQQYDKCRECVKAVFP